MVLRGTSDELSEVERDDLARCEAAVERGLTTFVEVGSALMQIRDGRLYRAEFATFEEYCQDRWGMSRIRAHQLIGASSVAANVLTVVNTPPTNERQARPLAPLEPDQQRVAWAHAVETAPEGRPSEAHVRRAVAELFPKDGLPDAGSSLPDRPDSAGIQDTVTSPGGDPSGQDAVVAATESFRTVARDGIPRGPGGRSAGTLIVQKQAKGPEIAPLRAPFTYIGGKRPAAGFVWAALGDPTNYVEPFCGSAAVLFARPHLPRVETLNDPTLLLDNFQRATHAERGDIDGTVGAFVEAINDLDPNVANVWRAIRSAPEEVARWADYPVNESYLYAVHNYLVGDDDAARFRERMLSDPDFFDPKRAGSWVYGACLWIGSGWCHPDAARHRKRPRLHAARQGDTHRFGGLGVHADRPPKFLGVDGHDTGTAGSCEWRRGWIVEWLRRLRDRLRHVRVCCGDWRRTCDSKSTTTGLGPTGIFFDCPYSAQAGRCKDLYNEDSLTVAHSVRDYCREWGPDPHMRIVLAGYAGEGHEVLEREGWSVLAWNNSRGYGNRTRAGRERAGRERLWLSPHCLPVPTEPPAQARELARERTRGLPDPAARLVSDDLSDRAPAPG
jgi:hypothetical protein